MSLTNMSDPKKLDLVVNQVQGNVGLVNMPDRQNLNLIVS